jgi:UDP-GlcNAc:undecaprenyl-phosphate GlcNAc-1-phosphate transferase
MTAVLVSGLVGFALAVGLTPVARSLAVRIGAVAYPVADRWHRIRVPLLGGLAIATSVVLGAAVAGVSPKGWVLLGAALLLSAVGLVDDLRPLKPQTKFVAQILVAAGLAGLGLQLRLTGRPSSAEPVRCLFLTAACSLSDEASCR